MNLSVLALRNLVREPKRTLIQVLAIGVVCAILIVWTTLTGGFYRTLYGAATNLWLGEAQIHHSRYSLFESIYDTIAFDKDHAEAILAAGYHAAPRLYAFALAAQPQGSRGIKLIGVDHRREMQVTSLHKHLAQGRWLNGVTPKEVVIGSQLAQDLGLSIGGELVIMGQAANGSLASDLYRVTGVMAPISQGADQRYVFINDDEFRNLFLIDSGSHEVVLRRTNAEAMPAINGGFNQLAKLYSGQDLRTWRELKPTLAGALDLLGYTTFFTLTFVYIAIAGFMVNIKLMAILDRTKEYGVMRALGMVEWQLMALIFLETIWICFFSLLVALAMGVPAALYIEKFGIDLRSVVSSASFIGVVVEPVLIGTFGWYQVIVPTLFLFVMLPLASLYPGWIAAKTSPSVAMKEEGGLG
jgi:ABC-type lipoprotein release transport system permease subunit